MIMIPIYFAALMIEQLTNQNMDKLIAVMQCYATAHPVVFVVRNNVKIVVPQMQSRVP